MSYDIPIDLINDFGVWIDQAEPTDLGANHVIDIRRSEAGHDDRRIVVYLIDENGMARSGVPIVFYWDTIKDTYQLTSDVKWLWNPQERNLPRKGLLTRTDGSGKAELILGPEGVVKAGESGGVTCYPLEPEYSPDIVHGLGMMPNHQGLRVTYQLQRVGVLPLDERLEAIEARLAALEGLWGE